jgi:hypothetical protein
MLQTDSKSCADGLLNTTAMHWFKHRNHGSGHASHQISPGSPPEWTPAVEQSNTYGLFNEASDESHEKAQEFCERNPVEPSALLSSHTLSDIANNGCLEWRIQVNNPSYISVNLYGKGGLSQIRSRAGCPDTCLLSNLPIVAGQYHFPSDGGVYYEITVHKMTDPTKGGTIAIGTNISAPSALPHSLFVRNCLQTIPLVETPWLESIECRTSSR